MNFLTGTFNEPIMVFVLLEASQHDLHKEKSAPTRNASPDILLLPPLLIVAPRDLFLTVLSWVLFGFWRKMESQKRGDS